jgi:hypothetical protein
MQINESTYETIFLLYIDNELSPKERLQVEAFIAENPSYALLMEELKATVLAPEKLGYPFKVSLKKQIVETALENIEDKEDEVENWSQTYSNYLMQDMQAIPGLSTQFKNSLKKESTSKGILIKPFGFNRNKFAYAAVAAMLMLFIGYKQFTKSPSFNKVASNLVADNTPMKKEGQLFKESTLDQTNNTITRNSNSNPSLEPQTLSSGLITAIGNENLIINSNALVNQSIETKETIAMVEPVELNTTATNTNTVSDKIINTLTNASTSAMDAEAELTTDATAPVSYEIIDTDDPNRTIYIANIEIDGNRLRGLKRRVSSLFKNNKSERNK